MRLLGVLLCAIVCCASPTAAHELAVYTVVVNAEGPQPADIPDHSLKVGDSAWFWMKDSTENTTLVIELTKNGNIIRSSELKYECELDDEGAKVDEDCETRFDVVFNQSYAEGTWDITFETFTNDTLASTLQGSVTIDPDHHDSSDESSFEFSVRDIASVVAIISLLCLLMIFATISPQDEEE